MRFYLDITTPHNIAKPVQNTSYIVEREIWISLTAHDNTIEWPVMIAQATHKDIGNIASRARYIGVIMSRTGDPRAGVEDVFLAVGVGKSEAAARKDGDFVFLVVDVCEARDVCVDPVGKIGITSLREIMLVGVRLRCKCGRSAYARETVGDGLDGNAGRESKTKRGCVQKRKSTTFSI